jgi:anti-sigma regulatory factor (Ser/Thr protein kinase)
MPDLASARGRGIALMRALVDEVELVTDGGGKVILTKYRRVE